MPSLSTSLPRTSRLPRHHGLRRALATVTRIGAAAAVLAAAAVGALGSLLVTGTASAATIGTCTWTAGAGVDWSTAGNWDCNGGTSNGPPTANDAVVFPASVPTNGGNPVLDTSESAASVTFDGAYTLTIDSGATLSLDPYDGGSGTSPYVALEDDASGLVTIAAASSTSAISLTGPAAAIEMASGTMQVFAPLTGGSSSFALGIITATSSGGTLDLDGASTYLGAWVSNHW